MNKKTTTIISSLAVLVILTAISIWIVEIQNNKKIAAKFEQGQNNCNLNTINKLESDNSEKQIEEGNSIITDKDKTIQKLKVENISLSSDYDRLKKALNMYKETNNQSTEHFTYSDFGNNFEVIKKEINIFDYFDVKRLYEDSCFRDRGLEYFENVLKPYNDTDKGYQYSFKYGKPSQDPDFFGIIVIPNKSYNQDQAEEFKEDFSVCAAGGIYPEQTSDNYLLFVYSCGSGFDDGSGLPHGCVPVKEIIEPTIKLK